MEIVENNQVAIIENSIEVLRSAPEILKANQNRTEKALIVGRSILEQWQAAWNIENEDERLKALSIADERSNKYLVNVSTAKKEETEARAVVTQIMDEMKKWFTECENNLDKTKSNTIPSKVQNWRDQFAKTSFEIKERKRKESERAAAKAREAIDIKTGFINALSTAFNDYLLQKKQKFQQKFNALQFVTFADDAAAIRQYHPAFKEDQFNQLVSSIKFPSSIYHTKDELQQLFVDATSNKMDEFGVQYIEQMTALKIDIVDKLKSKFEELKEEKRMADERAAEAERARLAEEERQKKIMAANAAQKKKLEEEARIAREEETRRQQELLKQQQAADEERKRREAEENERLQRESEEARKKAELEAEIKRQGDQTMVLFEQEAAMAIETPAPEVRQGYEIEILHPVGYTQIFAFYFDREGKNLPIDKLDNMKLGQMKTYCEKVAHKSGEMIESKFLKYKPCFTAVNRKAK